MPKRSATPRLAKPPLGEDAPFRPVDVGLAFAAVVVAADPPPACVVRGVAAVVEPAVMVNVTLAASRGCPCRAQSAAIPEGKTESKACFQGNGRTYSQHMLEHSCGVSLFARRLFQSRRKGNTRR